MQQLHGACLLEASDWHGNDNGGEWPNGEIAGSPDSPRGSVKFVSGNGLCTITRKYVSVDFKKYQENSKTVRTFV